MIDVPAAQTSLLALPQPQGGPLGQSPAEIALTTGEAESMWVCAWRPREPFRPPEEAAGQGRLWVFLLIHCSQVEK